MTDTEYSNLEALRCLQLAFQRHLACHKELCTFWIEFFFGGSVFNKVLVRGLCVSVSTANCESSGSAWLSWHWHFSSLYSLGQQPSWWRPRQTTTPPVSSGWRPADPPPPPSAWLSACSSKTGCLGADLETSGLQKESTYVISDDLEKFNCSARTPWFLK